jgi:CRP-like cAMP-binding protein
VGTAGTRIWDTDDMTVEWPILEGLEPTERQAVLDRAKPWQVAPATPVFEQGDTGDAMYLVVRGQLAVRVCEPHSGASAIVRFLGPGDAFGEMALMSPDAKRTASVEAFSDVELLELGRDQFERLRDAVSVDKFLFQLLLSRTERVSRELAEARVVPLEARIPRRLLELRDVFGGDDAPDTLPITPADLATITGAELADVKLRLGRLRVCKAIGYSRDEISWRDMDVLRREAGFTD